jgi:hypothetical protein
MAKKKPTRSASSAAAKPAPTAALVRRPDHRRWIYGGLDVVFLALQLTAVFMLQTRFTLDKLQLLSLPLCAGAMAGGMFLGGRVGWQIATAGCIGILAMAALLVLRIVVSSTYLGAVFGGFGQMATGIAILATALIVEVAVLLPLFQLKYLRTRTGRRAFGIDPPLPAATRAAT